MAQVMAIIQWRCYFFWWKEKQQFYEMKKLSTQLTKNSIQKNEITKKFCQFFFTKNCQILIFPQMKFNFIQPKRITSPISLQFYPPRALMFTGTEGGKKERKQTKTIDYLSCFSWNEVERITKSVVDHLLQMLEQSSF